VSIAAQSLYERETLHRLPVNVLRAWLRRRGIRATLYEQPQMDSLLVAGEAGEVVRACRVLETVKMQGYP
jgi:hypothetical protein